MKGSLKLLFAVVLLEVLGALEGNPIEKGITQFNESDEVDLSWRLPKAIYPISYVIELETKVHDDRNRDYSGSVAIHLDVRTPTDRIVIHSKDLVIKDVLLFIGVTTIDQIMYYEDETRDFLIIQSLEEFTPGSDVLLYIEFTGQLQLEGVGFYRSEYKVDGETRYLATTQFEASYAREAFPVFDGIYDA